MTTATTREQLLSHAQVLIRKRGYNGFSYRDLADEVGVKTASIHYYFPTKDDLLLAAVEGYTARLVAALNGIDKSLTGKERLDRYAQLFIDSPNDQICMCGSLAADLASLSERVQQALKGFFQLHERWLEEVLTQGVNDGTLRNCGDSAASARTLFAGMQGGLMGCRLFQDGSRLRDVVASVQVNSPCAAEAAAIAAA
jgi:TetR/AcrR family transcriptional repressor of nem operon